MILDSHPDRKNFYVSKYVGYWRPNVSRATGKTFLLASEEAQYKEEDNLPDPRDYIDPTWNLESRALIVELLKAGTPVVGWMGSSSCRLCGMTNGSHCYSATGEWIWPEGFAHYVECHGVRPPSELVDHLLSLLVCPELVAELKSRVPRMQAISDRWAPYRKGEGCPDRGINCTYRSTLCTKGNSSRHDGCHWYSDNLYAEMKAEQKRHRDKVKELTGNTEMFLRG